MGEVAEELFAEELAKIAEEFSVCAVADALSSGVGSGGGRVDQPAGFLPHFPGFLSRGCKFLREFVILVGLSDREFVEHGRQFFHPLIEIVNGAAQQSVSLRHVDIQQGLFGSGRVNQRNLCH